MSENKQFALLSVSAPAALTSWIAGRFEAAGFDRNVDCHRADVIAPTCVLGFGRLR